MKLADGREASPSLMDEATIALMQLSIDHLELLEQLAMELQARTSFRSSMRDAHKATAQPLPLPQRATTPVLEYQADAITEQAWDH